MQTEGSAQGEPRLAADPPVVPVEALRADGAARLDANEQNVAPGAKLLDDLLPTRRIDAVLLDAFVQVLPVAVAPLGLLRRVDDLLGLEELLVEGPVLVERVAARHHFTHLVGPGDAGIFDRDGMAGGSQDVRHDAVCRGRPGVARGRRGGKDEDSLDGAMLCVCDVWLRARQKLCAGQEGARKRGDENQYE